MTNTKKQLSTSNTNKLTTRIFSVLPINSYSINKIKLLWCSGVALLFLIMSTAFTGYGVFDWINSEKISITVSFLESLKPDVIDLSLFILNDKFKLIMLKLFSKIKKKLIKVYLSIRTLFFPSLWAATFLKFACKNCSKRGGVHSFPGKIVSLINPRLCKSFFTQQVVLLLACATGLFVVDNHCFTICFDYLTGWWPDVEEVSSVLSVPTLEPKFTGEALEAAGTQESVKKAVEQTTSKQPSVLNFIASLAFGAILIAYLFKG